MARKNYYANTLGTFTDATYGRAAKTNVRKQVKPRFTTITRKNRTDAAGERRENLTSAQKTNANSKLDKYTSVREKQGKVESGHIRNNKDMIDAKAQLNRLKKQNTDGRHDALIKRAESALRAKADYRALSPT